MADQELDARGLNCPMPILRAKQVMKGMSPGQTLRILTTDPESVKDFQAFAKQRRAPRCSNPARPTKSMFLF